MPPQIELKQKILQKYNFLFHYHNVGAKAQLDSVQLGKKKGRLKETTHFLYNEHLNSWF